MTHSKVDIIDYIGKLLSCNDDVTKKHDRVVVELQQAVSEKYHEVDFDYRSDIHITYEKRKVGDGKRQYAYVPTIVRYDGGSIQAFDDTPDTEAFIDWFNEGYKKAMTFYYPWFKKLKLRDLDIEGIHALCGNDEAGYDHDYGLFIFDVFDDNDYSFAFKHNKKYAYVPGTVMVERSRLNVNGICKALSDHADKFDLKPSYVIRLGSIEDNIIGDMAKQLMVNGAYNLLVGVLYPAANQPDNDILNIEVKLQHVVAKGLRPKCYRLSYNGHSLSKTIVPYVIDLKKILDDNHVLFKDVDFTALLPVFSGEGGDLRISHYQVDILVSKADAAKDSGSLTPHEHSDTAEGHTHGTSAPE